MNEIRLPAGTRDLSGEECQRKEELKRRIEKVFIDCGYQQLETPAIEYFDTFRNGYQDVKAEDMYRFFDRDGRMLVLREDMTVPAARVCASRFTNAEPPFRIRYCSDVFKVRNPFAGKRSQVTDCGIECIGIGESGDLEILSTAIDVMNQIGADNWSLEIGNAGFFANACKAVSLNSEDTHILGDLIDRKSLPELEDKLNQLALSRKEKEFFQQLPLLGGDPEVLDRAASLCFTEELHQSVEKLSKLYEGLKKIGKAENITFDFGKAPHLDYYTGIIFDGYVGNVGTAVLSGGRYDHLLEKFGRNLAACGFSVKLDYLLDSCRNIIPAEKVWKVYYPAGREAEAILVAQKCRRENPTELIPWDKDTIEVKK